MPRAIAAAFAAVLSVVCGAASAADFTIIGTPLLREQFTAPQNLTCYLSNVGKRPVQVRKLRFFNPAGELRRFDTNTCGPVGGFTLAPDQTCYVGLSGESIPQSSSYGCAALTDDPASVRGEVELRAGSTPLSVKTSAQLLAGEGSTGGGYEAFASPPMFGGSNQYSAECKITNLGTSTAKLTSIRLARSNGPDVALDISKCPQESGVATLAPGASCELKALPIPVSDLQCKALVTRRANLRGALIIFSGSALAIATHLMR